MRFCFFNYKKCNARAIAPTKSMINILVTSFIVKIVTTPVDRLLLFYIYETFSFLIIKIIIEKKHY